MGEGAGIQDQESDRIVCERLDAFDQFMLGIALEALETRLAPRGLGLQTRLDGVKRRVAIEAGLPTSQQIQIGPIDQQEASHRAIEPDRPDFVQIARR